MENNLVKLVNGSVKVQNMINRDLNVLRKMKACLSFLFRYRKIIPDPSGLRRVVVGRTAVRLSSCGFDQFSSAYERPLTPTDAQ